MRRIPLLAATGVLLVAGGTTGVVALAAGDPGASSSSPAPASQPEGKGGQGRGAGPPAWAQANGHAEKAGKAAKASRHEWKEAWQALSPAEREQRMKQLAAEHDRGMKAWTSCVQAAQGERDARSDCEKPTPPGLAKKQP